MANYYGAARSNYFKVKSLERFKQDLPAGLGIWDGKDGTVAVFSEEPDSGGWPSMGWDWETDTDYEIDVPKYVSEHLSDDEVAVFMEAGAEKLRYVVGYAEAINNKGERRQVTLNDIYKLAKELGPNVTHAEY